MGSLALSHRRQRLGVPGLSQISGPAVVAQILDQILAWTSIENGSHLNYMFKRQPTTGNLGESAGLNDAPNTAVRRASVILAMFGTHSKSTAVSGLCRYDDLLDVNMKTTVQCLTLDIESLYLIFCVPGFFDWESLWIYPTHERSVRKVVQSNIKQATHVRTTHEDHIAFFNSSTIHDMTNGSVNHFLDNCSGALRPGAWFWIRRPLSVVPSLVWVSQRWVSDSGEPMLLASVS